MLAMLTIEMLAMLTIESQNKFTYVGPSNGPRHYILRGTPTQASWHGSENHVEYQSKPHCHRQGARACQTQKTQPRRADV